MAASSTPAARSWPSSSREGLRLARRGGPRPRAGAPDASADRSAAHGLRPARARTSRGETSAPWLRALRRRRPWTAFEIPGLAPTPRRAVALHQRGRAAHTDFTGGRPPEQAPRRRSRRLAPCRSPASAGFVFVNGRFCPKRCRARRHRGGRRRSRTWAPPWPSGPGELEEPASRRGRPPGERLRALNTAFLEDGASSRWPLASCVAEPIHLVFASLGGDGPVVSHPGLPGRRSGAAAKPPWWRASSAAPADSLLHQRGHRDRRSRKAEARSLQAAARGAAAFHVSNLAVRSGRDSSFRNHSVSLGGALVRNEITTTFAGEGGQCELNGLCRGWSRAAPGHPYAHRPRRSRTAPAASCTRCILTTAARGVFRREDSRARGCPADRGAAVQQEPAALPRGPGQQHPAAARSTPTT